MAADAASSEIDPKADIAFARLGWTEPNNAIRRQVCLLLALSRHANALTNVRFWGLSGLDQPLLTNLDLEYTANAPVENDIRVKTTAT